MDVHLALYRLAERYQLDADGAAALHRVAGIEREPGLLAPRLRFGIGVLAAALGGFGLIFWIAANWDTFGRFGRFALLQVFFLAMCAGALWRPAARQPLALLALLAIGALFAYFGQTYQTGADPWQLFAVWAVLALPLCLAARSDALWAPWALVALTGVALCLYAHSGRRWEVQTSELGPHALAWGGALALTFALAPPLRRFTGAGPWALRTALLLTILLFLVTGIGTLLNKEIALQYWLALALLAGAAVMLATPRFDDIFGLSAVGLALNVLLVGGLSHLLLEGNNNSNELILRLLLLGVVAACLLGWTARWILRHWRRANGLREPA